MTQLTPEAKKYITQKQHDVVRCIADGMTANETAMVLSISKSLVNYYLQVLREEYECKSSAHLVATFLRNKIIE